MILQRWIGVVILSLLLLSSCVGQPQSTTTSISSPTEQILDYSQVEIAEGDFLRTEDYDLITIHLSYPRLRCPDNECFVANLVNQQVYEFVVKPEYSQWRPTRLNVDLKYTITECSDTIFSVLFMEHYSDVGSYYITNSALVFDSFGARLGLEDCIDVNAVCNQIEQGTLSFRGSSELLKIDAGLTEMEVYQLLLGFLSAGEQEQRNNFYITPSGIGVILLLDYPGMREELVIEIDCDLILSNNADTPSSDRRDFC